MNKHRKLIFDLLQSEADDAKAHSLHLEHQLSLPSHLRVNELSQEDMEESLQKLNLYHFDVQNAIRWLNNLPHEAPDIQPFENSQEATAGSIRGGSYSIGRKQP